MGTRGAPLFYVLLIVVALLLAAPARASLAPTPSCPNVVSLPHKWSDIKTPEWRPTLISTYGAKSMSVDPRDPSRILIAATNEMFQTKDGGCNWTKVFPADPAKHPFLDCQHLDWLTDSNMSEAGINPGCGQIYDLQYAPESSNSDRAYIQVAFSHQSFAFQGTTLIFVSDDGGSSWNLLDQSASPATMLGRGALAIAPSDPSTLYLSRKTALTGDVNLFVSHDGGKTWDLSSASIPSNDLALLVDPANPKELWDYAYNSNVLGRYMLRHSNDEGKIWQIVDTPLGSELEDLAVVIQPSGMSLLAATTLDRAYISRDSGKTWQEILERPGAEHLSQVRFDAAGRFLYVIGDSDLVGRYDLRRRVAFVIKDGEYSDGTEGDWHFDYAAQYVRGSGLYLLDGCSRLADFTCDHIFRFKG